MSSIQGFVSINLPAPESAVGNNKSVGDCKESMSALNGLWLTTQELLPLREKARSRFGRAVVLGREIVANDQALSKSQLKKILKRVALIVCTALVFAFIIGCAMAAGFGASALISLLSPALGAFTPALSILAQLLIAPAVFLAVHKSGLLKYLQDVFSTLYHKIDNDPTPLINQLHRNMTRWSTEVQLQDFNRQNQRTNVKQVKTLLPLLERLNELPVLEFVLESYGQLVYHKFNHQGSPLLDNATLEGWRTDFLMEMNDFLEPDAISLVNRTWSVHELVKFLPAFIHDYDQLALKKNAAKQFLEGRGVNMADACSKLVLSYMIERT